ncbi:DUF3320 domain-containing protein [Actinomadura parmotrematis]|uniref:DUF3320 domain-containing protein n=1 Tax=Actinomadura parmotrematis TaxID=2864039 RepID=A0ABS7G1V2_9ACTN|nr:DUF3320 domain-containing protein [Actinomadura parmotrematis]MBW8486195.1 DUF3320 domain-containing protein [Actinomadura parmotrematis]
MDEQLRAQLRNVLGRWRDDLIDLTGRNRLLNFRPTRTATLEIRSPSADSLLADLDSGLRFAELPESDESPADLADADGIVTQKTTGASLSASLRKLYRDSNQVFNDTGLWTLQLGVAFLKWREPGAEGFNLAPLLLVPVRLDRLGPGLFRLIAEQSEDAVPNPALAVKMGQLGVDWPDPDSMQDLSGALSAVRAAVAGHSDWEVDEDVVLATFRSHKEAMYRDLLDNEDQILAHPLVQAIGLGEAAHLPEDALYFDPLDADRIDELQPPELTPLVLDADSSQRQCVAAALDGRSFIMDGPPGTGKSQTIANMIAALMHQGRSVLFVSEKAAALDVVRDRLEKVGLGTFVLALHSHHASRKKVAKTLGKALSQRPKAARSGSREDRQRLQRTRRDLSAYAAAMNETRSPLGLTLHEVIGRLSALADTCSLPTALPGGLTAEGFQDIRDAAAKLGDAWRPAAEGRDFAWYGLIGIGQPQPCLQLLRERADVLGRRLAVHADLAASMGLTDLGDAERLLALLDRTAGRPYVPETWLTVPDLAALRTRISEFTACLGDLRAAIGTAADEVGDRWDSLPSGLPATPTVAENALAELSVEGLDLSVLTEEGLRSLAAHFQEMARLLRGVHASLTDIAAVYGMPAPETIEQALGLCRLTDFARRRVRPEAAWLTHDGRSAAARAATELEKHVIELAQARAAAGQVFTEGILGVPEFPAVVRRFGETRGIAKLSGSHRVDRQLLAGLTVTGEWSKEASARLPQALAWYEAAMALRLASASSSRLLGRYWLGERTDFNLIRGLLESAENICRLAGPLDVPAALADQVSADGRPDTEVYADADRIRERLDQWRRTLLPAPRPAGRPRLAYGPLLDAAAWYESHLQPMADAAKTIAVVQSVATATTPLTLREARRITAQVEEVRAGQKAFLVRRARDEQLIGTLYSGAGTDTAALSVALDWVAGVRTSDEPMPEQAARVLLAARPDEELRMAWTAFRAAVTEFVQLFDSDCRPDLCSRLLGAASAFDEITGRLAADRSGPDEWRSFRDAQKTLRRYGLDGLIGRAAEKGLGGTQFPRAAERAVLEAWTEQIMTGDRRLAPVRAVERDKLVNLFRSLDRALVSSAHAQVIDECNARRPRPNVGQAAVIQREAEKKSRHMPVRTLLGRTSDIIPLVKPCFMMSPLTVSQFLPPGYRFDVVIFDEASQVLPQDAVNCVYRGGSLIVAGDQKQLPPTDFFAQTDDSGDDEYDEDVPDSFDSLLDMCKGSGLIRSLSLSWHYRSRHEGLIAFSKNQFYENLVTFPGAFESGDDVGVTFSKVPGVYERGRSRSNPIEAAAVAARVLQHFRTRPNLSLGVVAMSDAQARAIEDAVERARTGHPELEEFFAEDRLNGFFIKNLETVQGDERDVVILSIGYGPGPDGRLTMAFGPLTRENGWRRLNVAVTRARRRIEVISSISGSDIQKGTNKSRGHFKKYLDYAERGPAALNQEPTTDDAAPESPFEESVLDVLTGWGYDVQPQVGAGSYRIDMAVRHPALPGRFALGIECDGAMYHSSKTARDRDRLREEVLRGLGWELHRIWGTDWYRNRPEAEVRLREAVESAVAVASERPEPDGEQDPVMVVPEPPQEVEPPRVTMESIDDDQRRSWAAPYRRVHLDGHFYRYEIHEPESRALLQRLFRKALDAEAPTQRDVLYRRVATVWGIERIGSRIRSNLDAALTELLLNDPEVEQNGDTVTVRGRRIVPREPGDGVSRRVTEVPPAERRLALLGLIRESPGISESDLTFLAARFFGWNRRGSEIAHAFNQDLVDLQKEGLIGGLPDRIVPR